jgi:hypothetical protein
MIADTSFFFIEAQRKEGVGKSANTLSLR